MKYATGCLPNILFVIFKDVPRLSPCHMDAKMPSVAYGTDVILFRSFRIFSDAWLRWTKSWQQIAMSTANCNVSWKLSGSKFKKKIPRRRIVDVSDGHITMQYMTQRAGTVHCCHRSSMYVCIYIYIYLFVDWQLWILPRLPSNILNENCLYFK